MRPKAFATIEFLRSIWRVASDRRRRLFARRTRHRGTRRLSRRARLTLHGAGKSDEELRAARDGRVGTIVVDGVEELERLAALARDGCGAAVVAASQRRHRRARRTPSCAPAATTRSSVSIRATKSGRRAIPARNPQLRFRRPARAHRLADLQSRAYLANASASARCGATRFAARGLPIARIVDRRRLRRRDDPDAASDRSTCRRPSPRLANVCRSAPRERGLPVPRLGIEPGRAIVAGAGTTLYRVLAVKRQIAPTFVVVDGGIAENPRPALYGAQHHVAPADRERWTTEAR